MKHFKGTCYYRKPNVLFMITAIKLKFFSFSIKTERHRKNFFPLAIKVKRDKNMQNQNICINNYFKVKFHEVFVMSLNFRRCSIDTSVDFKLNLPL